MHRVLLVLVALLALAAAQSCQCDAGSLSKNWVVAAVSSSAVPGFGSDHLVGQPQLPSDLACAVPSPNTSWAVVSLPTSVHLVYAESVYPTALSFFERSGGGLDQVRVLGLDIFGNAVLFADIGPSCNCSAGVCGNCTEPLNVTLGLQPASPRVSELYVQFGDNSSSSCAIQMYIDAIALEGYTNCSCCGNGLVEFGETCDDGNYNGTDGCDASCQTEPGWTCAGEPSVCSLLNNATSSTSSSLSSSTSGSTSTSSSTTSSTSSSTTTTTSSSGTMLGSTSGPTAPQLAYVTFVFTYPLTNLPNYPTQEEIMQALTQLSPSAVLDPRSIGFYSAVPTLPPGAFIITVTVNSTSVPQRTAQENAAALVTLLNDPGNQKALGDLCKPKACSVEAVASCTSSPPCASATSPASAISVGVALVAALALLLSYY